MASSNARSISLLPAKFISLSSSSSSPSPSGSWYFTTRSLQFRNNDDRESSRRKACGEIRNRARACLYSRCKSICRLFDSSPSPPAFSSPRHCHYGPVLSTLCWFPKWIASKRLVVRNSMKNKGQTTLFHPPLKSRLRKIVVLSTRIYALPPSFFFIFYFYHFFTMAFPREI